MAMRTSRRAVLTGAGALAISITLSRPAWAATAATSAGAAADLTAYLTIDRSGQVTLTSPVTEMGQGTHTAHAAMIADELGVALDAIRVVVGKPSPPMRRGNPATPNVQGSQSSGGSWGVRGWITPLRTAAAQARQVLLQAAASRWGVAPETLTLDAGVVRAADGRTLGIGVLAAEAARLPLPDKPALKPRSAWTHMGQPLRRLDLPAKARGAPVYASDFTLPGMVHACARLSPVFGAPVAGFDKASALKVAGVLDVVPIPHGVAVVARTSWAAMRGAEALEIRWRETGAEALDSAAISRQMRAGLDAPAAAGSRNDGDWDAVAAAAARIVSADYEVPYLAHACMEPFTCVVRADASGCEIWSGTQAQDRARTSVARDAGYAPDAVIIHTLYAGGGFGRRLRDEEGFAGAVAVARAVGRPVRFFHTREDELAQGWYRPAQAARLQAALDAAGTLTGLRIRTAGPSMIMDFAPGRLKDGDLDATSVQSLSDTRYRFGAYRLDYVMVRQPVPTAPWTSVGSTQNGYFLEAFLDEVARAAGKDPYQLRRVLLAHDARALRVLDTAAQKAGWGTQLPAGHARGIAYVESYGSLCAQVAEVSLVEGRPRVHRMVVALDCGDVITPDGARAQVEGRVMQGVSVALHEAMPISGGAAAARNFDTYPILRMSEAPRIDVHFIRSGEPLGGVGEPPLPPSTPAVVNAVAALTGQPIRTLPIRLDTA